MKKFNEKSTKKYDYPIYCDICGDKTWYSQSFELENETGHGGLIVCANDRDAIDYGLVPYTIEAEKSPDIVRIDTLQIGWTGDEANPVENLDPWGGELIIIVSGTWESLSDNWENITTNWEDLG